MSIWINRIILTEILNANHFAFLLGYMKMERKPCFHMRMMSWNQRLWMEFRKNSLQLHTKCHTRRKSNKKVIFHRTNKRSTDSLLILLNSLFQQKESSSKYRWSHATKHKLPQKHTKFLLHFFFFSFFMIYLRYFDLCIFS